MKLKTDDPFVPEDIRAKINGLQSLLDHAADLYSDIYSWYDSYNTVQVKLKLNMKTDADILAWV
ncbi:hypothetical protein I6E91_27520, partial [Enterocloster clostridioformis]|nr:hypothetical protein [Enterocloster clostridioformis]